MIIKKLHLPEQMKLSYQLSLLVENITSTFDGNVVESIDATNFAMSYYEFVTIKY